MRETLRELVKAITAPDAFEVATADGSLCPPLRHVPNARIVAALAQAREALAETRTVRDIVYWVILRNWTAGPYATESAARQSINSYQAWGAHIERRTTVIDRLP